MPVPGFDLELLRAEIALQASLSSSASRAASFLPVPELAGLPDPVIDGRLDDPLWGSATLFQWKAVGDASWRLPFAWSVRVALKDGSIYFAGSRDGPIGPREMLSLDSSWRERLVLCLRFGGGSFCRVECPGSTSRVEAHGGAFAASVTSSAARWELKLAREGGIWPVPLGATRPLQLTASRGLLGEIFVSPAFHLQPAPLAVQVREIQGDEERRVSARTEMANFTGQKLDLLLSPVETKILPPKSRLAIEFAERAPAGDSGLGWSFRIGDRHCRIGVPANYLEPEALERSAQEALALAVSNARKIPSSRRAGSAALSEEIGRLRDRIKTAGEGGAGIEKVFFEARALARQALLARVPPEVGEILFAKRFHYRYGPYYTTYLHDMPGGNLCAWSIREGRLRDLLEPPDGASVRDPALHPDGRRIVFAMREHGGGTHLFTVESAGGGLRQVTRGEFHDLEPCFVPGGRIVFGSTRAGARNPANDTDNYCLHAVSEDGSGLRRLSYNYLADFTPAVLPDGRILFLRWVHEDKPGNFINALWTMNPDGTALAGFFGMTRPGVFLEPQPVPGTSQVVCLDSGSSGHWRSPQVGDIGVIDASLSDREFVYRIEAGRGGFKNPYPLGADLFLASWGWTDTRWGIYLLDSKGSRELLYRDPEISCFNPIPLRPREEINGIPAYRAADDSTPATLAVQDIYQGLPGVPRGAIRRLRVVAVPDRPSTSMHGFLDQRAPVSILNRMVRRDLGTVPVHGDGSLHFQVPPNLSLFFQALDEEGRAVQTMRDTISFAPGEKRACIGCHEPRRLAPAQGSASVIEALRSPPAALAPPEGPASIHFARDLQPILDRHCISCHDAADPAGGVILSGDPTPYFSLAYERLTRGGDNYNHQNWGEAPRPNPAALAPAATYVTSSLPPGASGSRTSRLMRLLEEGHQGVKLEGREKRELARWIDLNLPYYNDWETGRAEKAARVEKDRAGKGSERRLLSGESEGKIQAILRARCRGCHLPPDLFRGAVISLSRPPLSPLLRAPLAKDQGGLGWCAKPVFQNRQDRDYNILLETLEKEKSLCEDSR